MKKMVFALHLEIKEKNRHALCMAGVCESAFSFIPKRDERFNFHFIYYIFYEFNMNYFNIKNILYSSLSTPVNNY